MGMVGDQWEVTRGDCLWNIAKAVYGDPYMWGDIANENDIPLDRANIIYPGQILDLPGITASTPDPGPPPPPPEPPAYTRTPEISWFSLRAGTQREMMAVWNHSHYRFQIRWEIWDETSGQLALESEQDVTIRDRALIVEHTFNDSDTRFKCRFSVRALDDNGNPVSPFAWKEYDFRNNPPRVPSTPEIAIDDKNELTVTLNNIASNINANQIEISIYQDDTLKYNTAKVGIDNETHFAKYVCTVDPGHFYKIRCRAVRGSAVSAWTEFTSNVRSRPVAPEEITVLRTQKILDQQSNKYGVYVEWKEEPTANKYLVEWTSDIQNFNNPSASGINSQTTEPNSGPRLLIPDIGSGVEWFFRIKSMYGELTSLDASPIKSVKVGTVPGAPTTWSNVSAAVLGEDINLYWAHNSTDGSAETYGQLHVTIIDSAHPELVPMEWDEQIENTRSEEEKYNNSVYTINTEDPEWSGLLADGFKIKWKVRTAGITGEFGAWSIEREINVYAKPTLTLDLLNSRGNSIETISAFPFYISILARPQTQKPISYYIEIIANQSYKISDDIGEVKVINAGEKIYQKFYSPERNAWRFLVEITPADLDLHSEISYTLNISVAMDSGLSCTESIDFTTYFLQSRYSTYANIYIDKDTLTANINPYCMEYYTEQGEEEPQQRMTDNCTISVYRREYDGTFTEIAKDLENEENLYVMDPHPSLDYARYRIVARAKDTGAISYADIKAVEVGEPAIVIQWSEKWYNFDYDLTNENYKIEVPWSGSMLKLPYNVDVSENKNIDVSLIEYVGRKHPVSYYGTQIGESATWNCEIPADDKETLYGLRRLSRWTGDVYVREPSGTGYWANITVSLSKKHLDVVIPVSFSVKRVEGGM